MMASKRAREKLARAARSLNRRAGAHALPSLIFMTEEERVVDPVSAMRDLPKGTAVILRHRDRRHREAYAREMNALARARRSALLIAGDAPLAARLGARGAHFPEAQIGEVAHWRAMRPHWLITVAAHSERTAIKAARAGADAVLLAPVFPTRSHPETRGLGPLVTRVIASRSSLPLYALGGVDEKNVARLAGAKLAGFAAIGALL
jgi:thiamine-phosphate pyrophosphorylase